MKKLTEYKELVADEVKHSMLPVENCVFWNIDRDNSFKGTLIHICARDYPFKRKEDGGVYRHCAKLVKRYPRDVPEGVEPLPEDKPFLAYVGHTSHFSHYPDNGWWVESWDSWIKLDEFILNNPSIQVVNAAIDVSTEWAQLKFPKIVEAMEYEAIYSKPYYDLNQKDRGMATSTTKKGYHVGHKLGDRTYDLDWKEVVSEPMDKMEKVPATLSLEVTVNCPHCDAYLDLAGAEFPYLNDEGQVLGQLFKADNPSWKEDFEVESVECPECGKEFNVEGIEW